MAKKLKLDKAGKGSVFAMLSREIEDFQGINDSLVCHIANARDVSVRNGEFDTKFIRALTELKEQLAQGERKIKRLVLEAKKQGG